jgi:5'-methylthioadenosine phosphorylase
MKVGIIGGSGLYGMEQFQQVGEISLETPFGAPSDAYVHGTLGGREVYFLPRHGRGHRLMPSEINHRANIWGFKKLGVATVLSVCAVGSLQERYRPRDIVLPDQFFDRTKDAAAHTYFGDGVVGHVGFGDPLCSSVRSVLAEVAREQAAQAGTGVQVHEGGTYVNMAGPAFSTRAESGVYRQFGFDVIGMTALGEAKLCREAELCYQAMTFITDYDCWHEEVADVTAEMVVGHLMANVSFAKLVLAEVVTRLPDGCAQGCRTALSGAVVTDPGCIGADVRERLGVIMGAHLGGA